MNTRGEEEIVRVLRALSSKLHERANVLRARFNPEGELGLTILYARSDILDDLAVAVAETASELSKR